MAKIKRTFSLPRGFKRLKCNTEYNYQCGGKCQRKANKCSKNAGGMPKDFLDWAKHIAETKEAVAGINERRAGGRSRLTVDDLGFVKREKNPDYKPEVKKQAETAIGNDELSKARQAKRQQRKELIDGIVSGKVEPLATTDLGKSAKKLFKTMQSSEKFLFEMIEKTRERAKNAKGATEKDYAFTDDPAINKILYQALKNDDVGLRRFQRRLTETDLQTAALEIVESYQRNQSSFTPIAATPKAKEADRRSDKKTISGLIKEEAEQKGVGSTGDRQPTVDPKTGTKLSQQGDEKFAPLNDIEAQRLKRNIEKDPQGMQEMGTERADNLLGMIDDFRSENNSKVEQILRKANLDIDEVNASVSALEAFLDAQEKIKTAKTPSEKARYQKIIDDYEAKEKDDKRYREALKRMQSAKTPETRAKYQKILDEYAAKSGQPQKVVSIADRRPTVDPKTGAKVSQSSPAEKRSDRERGALGEIEPSKLRKTTATYSGRKVVRWERVDGEDVTQIRVMQISKGGDKYYVTEPYPVEGGKYQPLTDPMPLRDANKIAQKLITGALPAVKYTGNGFEYFPSEYVRERLSQDIQSKTTKRRSPSKATTKEADRQPTVDPKTGAKSKDNDRLQYALDPAQLKSPDGIYLGSRFVTEDTGDRYGDGTNAHRRKEYRIRQMGWNESDKMASQNPFLRGKPVVIERRYYNDSSKGRYDSKGLDSQWTVEDGYASTKEAIADVVAYAKDIDSPGHPLIGKAKEIQDKRATSKKRRDTQRESDRKTAIAKKKADYDDWLSNYVSQQHAKAVKGKKQKINLNVQDENGNPIKESVDATVYGTYAVHKNLIRDRYTPDYTISDVKTGLKIGDINTIGDARLAVNTMHHEVGSDIDLSQATPEEKQKIKEIIRAINNNERPSFIPLGSEVKLATKTTKRRSPSKPKAATPAKSGGGNGDKDSSTNPKLDGNRRSIDAVTLFNPFDYGDVVELNGKEWQVRQDTGGWYLSDDGTYRGMHPTIKNIEAMDRLISAIAKEKNKGYTPQNFSEGRSPLTSIQKVKRARELRAKPQICYTF